GEAVIGAQRATHVEAADVRQVDVEEDEVDGDRLCDGERRAAVAGLEDLDSLVLQRHSHQLDHVRLVVGDENGKHGATCGKARTTRESAIGADLRPSPNDRLPHEAGGVPPSAGRDYVTPSAH